MTNNNHPITPPPELVAQIRSDALHKSDGQLDYELRLIHAGYCAGADQELEACCEWLELHYPHVYTTRLKRCRRPKPPSLKEQALAKLEAMERLWEASGKEPSDTIRCALESLPD